MDSYIDVDSTDGFLDRPEPLYEGGKTWDERRAEKGLPSDPAEMAAELERRGHKLPDVPRVDH